MALTPADFAAYSRATGTPYPEDPQERAALAPEVLRFRQNQFRAPQQESNPLAALGATALGIGALAGGIAAAKGLRRADQAFTLPRPVAKSAGTQQDVRNLDAIVKRRAAERLEQEARQQRPQGLVLTNLPQANVVKNPWTGGETVVDPFGPGTVPPVQKTATIKGTQALPVGRATQEELEIRQRLLEDPELLKFVEAEEMAAANVLPENRAEQARQQEQKRRAQSFLAQEAIDELRAEQSITSQAIGALESGEDQMTARVMRGVQRNEDLDASQVNQVARQTGNADVAASMTPDGVPKDQTNLWGEATLPTLTQEGQQYGPEPLRLLPAATQGRQQQAQSFLAQKRQELSGQFGPTRTERILSENPELLEAAELYATTGDPNVLSRLSTTPSTPLTVKPTVQMGINAEEFPTGQFYKKTGYPENTGDLLERDIELTNQISSIGLQQQQLAAKAQELGEQELMLRVAMDRDPESGGAYTKMFGQVKYEQQNLPKPESLNVDLGDALEERDFLRRYMGSLESLGSTYKLGDFQEGVRPFYEYDAQGNIVPQTLELRGGRRSVDLEPKTGGGRLFAEYDPEGQTGSTLGVYGVEQTSRRSGESTRPTQMTMNELTREGLEQATASPEGDVPIPPSLEQMTERKPTSVARRSIDASQIVRQAIIEGRDPQLVLRQRGFNV